MQNTPSTKRFLHSSTFHLCHASTDRLLVCALMGSVSILTYYHFFLRVFSHAVYAVLEESTAATRSVRIRVGSKPAFFPGQSESRSDSAMTQPTEDQVCH